MIFELALLILDTCTQIVAQQTQWTLLHYNYYNKCILVFIVSEAELCWKGRERYLLWLWDVDNIVVVSNYILQELIRKHGLKEMHMMVIASINDFWCSSEIQRRVILSGVEAVQSHHRLKGNRGTTVVCWQIH